MGMIGCKIEDRLDKKLREIAKEKGLPVGRVLREAVIRLVNKGYPSNDLLVDDAKKQAVDIVNGLMVEITTKTRQLVELKNRSANLFKGEKVCFFAFDDVIFDGEFTGCIATLSLDFEVFVNELKSVVTDDIVKGKVEALWKDLFADIGKNEHD